jgi:hypothetical protein
MLRITVNEIVLEQLRRAFPSPANSAKRALDKYVRVLEDKINACLNMGRTEWARKRGAYDISLEKLNNDGGQIGRDKVRLHKWLVANNLSLVRTVELGTKFSGKVSVVKLTELVTITDDMSMNTLKDKTEKDLDNFLNDLTVSDIDFVNTLFPTLSNLTGAEAAELFDLAPIDVESVKCYINWLLHDAKHFNHQQRETTLRQAQVVLRISQHTKGVLPMEKIKSTFGRTYYSGVNVQNVHKSLREAMLGDSYEYDIRSSVISWKMGFARECCQLMGTDQDVNNEFTAILGYLQDKKDFMATVLHDTFDKDSTSDRSQQEKIVKKALTAFSFGARLSERGWFEANGVVKSPSLVTTIKNRDERKRFTNSRTIKKFVAEQKLLDQYIFKKFTQEYPELLLMKELQTRSGRASKSKVMAWLYQHAETTVMHVVRGELQKLNVEVIANVHDAIVVRQKLTKYQREEIEFKMREVTNIKYWRLGETKYESYQYSAKLRSKI